MPDRDMEIIRRTAFLPKQTSNTLTNGTRTYHATRHILPPQRVALKVSIQQGVPKVLQAPLPGQQHVLHQEGCHQHAEAVVEPSCRPEAPHARVH